MKKIGFFLITILAFMTLACSLGSNLPFIGGSEIDISPEDVALAATRAAEVANQAGELAATAVTQGDQAVSTAIAQNGDVATLIPDLSNLTLDQKLTNIQPDANGNFVVLITEDDLNQFITGQADGSISGSGFGVDDARIQIFPDRIELTGSLVEPIQAPLNIALRPVINNGQVEFQILRASLAGLPMPASLLDLVGAAVNSEIGSALLGLPANVTIQDAALSEGLLTIMGHQQ